MTGAPQSIHIRIIIALILPLLLLAAVYAQSSPVTPPDRCPDPSGDPFSPDVSCFKKYAPVILRVDVPPTPTTIPTPTLAPTPTPLPSLRLDELPLTENDIDGSGTFFLDLDRAIENDEAAAVQNNPQAALREYAAQGRITSWRREFTGSSRNQTGLTIVNSQVIQYATATGAVRGATYGGTQLLREDWQRLSDNAYTKQVSTLDIYAVYIARCNYLTLIQYALPAGSTSDEGNFLVFLAARKLDRAACT